MKKQKLIPHLFRTEFSKIVSVLCKKFGLANIQLAEDIASETFLVATETWGLKGIPDNPVAWLYTVAKNKTKDQLKRKQIFEQKIKAQITKKETVKKELDLSPQNITDSQLQMLFAICQPAIKQEAQIGLALRILCGFGIEEIAHAFLSNKETINKRLYRAKESLRKQSIQLTFPKEEELSNRLDNVLSILYLLFNEGYYSSTQQKPIRKDLCLEAMRLTHLLINNKLTNQAQVNALLALMCFHASRFEARLSTPEKQVLYYEQNRNLWDEGLIEKGEYYLKNSAIGSMFTKYHLEAGISFWHTRKKDSLEKWESILQLYNKLLQIEYSPIAALNRTYALSRANNKIEAIKEAEKIDLKDNRLYHALLAELYHDINLDKEKHHLQLALSLTKSINEKRIILNKMAKL